MRQADHLYPEQYAPDDLMEAVRKMIVDGDLKPGERIRQRRTAQELGVSVTPFREALSRLERCGLMERIDGLGVFVRRYTREDVRDLDMIRVELEGVAARLSAERSSEDEVVDLESASQILSEALESEDSELAREADIAFRRRVARMSGCAVLERDLETDIFLSSCCITAEWTESTKSFRQSGRGHLEVVSAIRSRDADAAEQAMRRYAANSVARCLHDLGSQRNHNPHTANHVESTTCRA